ncbi:MAG: type II toxin-antitoxin system RelE/ParE family toxin [Algicola sp.]|nr:type II toxin-antitoxin system RelE/ParE family toxin [Algicola sp.]
MKIFKTHWFNKWAKKENLPDNALIVAVMEIERGLVDANLGGHVVKKRVAMPGRGKRGSMRTIVAYDDKMLKMAVKANELTEVEYNE